LVGSISKDLQAAVPLGRIERFVAEDEVAEMSCSAEKGFRSGESPFIFNTPKTRPWLPWFSREFTYLGGVQY